MSHDSKFGYLPITSRGIALLALGVVLWQASRLNSADAPMAPARVEVSEFRGLLWTDDNSRPPTSPWHRKLVGDDFYTDVSAANLIDCPIAYANLANLESFPELQLLDLRGKPVGGETIRTLYDELAALKDESVKWLDASGIELIAAVDSAVYRVGDPIRLDLTMKNTTSHAYKVINPRMPSDLSAFGVRLMHGNDVLMNFVPSNFPSNYCEFGNSGPPEFQSLGPGQEFRNSICLQHWLQFLNRPLPEGDYELTIAFDSAEFDGIYPKRSELVHRWDAKPVKFTIKGPMRTDPKEIINVIGEKAGFKNLNEELVSQQEGRRDAAWVAIFDYGDSRLQRYLDEARSGEPINYFENIFLGELAPVEFHR